MAEVRWIVGCVGLMTTTAVLFGSPPDTQLIILLGLLAVINLFTTIINLAQAWRRDPRFLSGVWLGLIQSATGAGLLGFFVWIGQAWGSVAVWLAFSYLIAGIAVLLAAGLRCFQFR